MRPCPGGCASRAGGPGACGSRHTRERDGVLRARDRRGAPAHRRGRRSIDEPGVHHQARDHLRRARAARAGLPVGDRGLRGGRAERWGARGRPGAQGQGRSEAHAGEFLAAAAQPARPGAARDPGRPRARPHLLRRQRPRPCAFRRAADAPVQHGTRRAAGQLQGGAALLRAGQRSAPGADPGGARAAASAGRQPPGAGQWPVRRLGRPAQGRRAGRLSRNAPHLQRPLRRELRRARAQLQRAAARSLRARPVSRVVARAGRDVHRDGARRGSRRGRASYRRRGVAGAGRGRARHEQVLEQRHGAAALPDAGGGGGGCAGHAGEGQARDPRVAGRKRAVVFRNWCWRTAPGSRVSSASAREISDCCCSLRSGAR